MDGPTRLQHSERFSIDERCTAEITYSNVSGKEDKPQWLLYFGNTCHSFSYCSFIMPRKGKKTNHTASEIAAKIAAHKPRGGGAAGVEERKPKCALVCPLCKAEIHNATMMIQHYVARHPTAAPPAPSP